MGVAVVGDGVAAQTWEQEVVVAVVAQTCEQEAVVVVVVVVVAVAAHHKDVLPRVVLPWAPAPCCSFDPTSLGYAPLCALVRPSLMSALLEAWCQHRVLAALAPEAAVEAGVHSGAPAVVLRGAYVSWGAGSWARGLPPSGDLATFYGALLP